MTFEIYTAERERCAEDLFNVTARIGELEEALILEAQGGIESSRPSLLQRVHDVKVADGHRAGKGRS